MRWTTFTSLYPNAAFPAHGAFVRARLAAMLRRPGGSAAVVAPVPWFPPIDGFGERSRLARVPRVERDGEVEVHHPRYPLLPRVSTNLHARLLRFGAEPTVRRVSAGSALLDAHYLYPDGVAASAIGLRLGLPVVLTARGSDVNLLLELPGPRAQVRRSLASSAAVVAVSEILRRRLCQATGFPEERVEVVGNGVDRSRFRPGERASARATLGLPADGKILLAVNRLAPGKRVDLLVAAIARLAPPKRPLLVCVGEGPLREAFERNAREAGIADRVRFVGARRPEELPEWYRAADAFALASDREGHPNVLLEAIACGIPVAASAVGAVPEIVGPDVGALVASNDAPSFAAAIDAVLERRFDPSELARRASRWSWEAAAERLAAIFERAASGGRGGR